MERKELNIYILGVAFMLVYCSNNVPSNAQQSVTQAFHQSHPDFNLYGYFGLAIGFLTNALTCALTPIIVTSIGTIPSLVIGGITFALFSVNLIWPINGLFYVFNGLAGVGTGLLWTAYGHCFAVSTTPEKISAHSAIFWVMYQCNMIAGNLVIVFNFSDVSSITNQSRITVFSITAGLALIGTVVFLFIKIPSDSASREKFSIQSVVDIAISAFKLFYTSNALKTCFPIFISVGIAMGFYTGVYGTSVGNSLLITNCKQAIGICGAMIGVGEVLGGIYAYFLQRFSRHSFVLISISVSSLEHMILATHHDEGALPLPTSTVTQFRTRCNITTPRRSLPKIHQEILHLTKSLASVLEGVFATCGGVMVALINLPNLAPLKETYSLSISQLTPNVFLAAFGAFLLGLGDSCLETQLFYFLAEYYDEKDVIPAVAFFQFTNSIGCALCFIYSYYFTLIFHVCLILGLNMCALVSIFVISLKYISTVSAV